MTPPPLARALAGWALLLLLPVVGQAQSARPVGVAPRGRLTPRWEAIGPRGGFLSAVAFQPGSTSTLLVSGDDASGLYRSTDDGASWALIEDAPPESSVYGLHFDPTDPTVVYGYSHFGRGVLRSLDGGASWQDASLGLPFERLFDLTISPTDPAHLTVATATALHESFDGGGSWAPLPAGPPGGTLTALSRHASTPGLLYAGSQQADGSGAVAVLSAGQWTTVGLFPGGVSDIVQSSGSLYVSEASGAIYRADPQLLDWTQIASGSGDPAPDIPSLYWTRLAVVEGGGPAGDRLYVAAWAERGFFRGDQGPGGWSWTQAGADIDWLPGVGNYGFSVACDPGDPDDVLLGTIGGGLFRSQDGGASFVAVDGGFLCTDSLGLALDASDPLHMVASSTEGFDGTPGVYETRDGGTNWSLLPLTVDVMELWISPLDGEVIVAGLVTDGLIRSTDGGKTWNTVLPSAAGALQIMQLVDHPTPGWVLAVFSWVDGGYDPAAGLYLSQDEGASWTRLTPQPGTCVAVDPADAQHIVYGGFGVLDSGDGGASWQATPGFAGKLLFSLALDPHQPGSLYAGGIAGDVYGSSDGGQTVQQLATPTADSVITGILVDPVRPGVVWIASTGVDAMITPQTTYGLLGSRDGGASWRWFNDGLFPGRTLWSLRFAPGDSSTIVAGMWGGSVQRLAVPPAQLP